jgi:1,4-alpha-glucan branching enzyme
VYLGGLGFAHKWNMGWMHDTLDYFSNDPVYRRFHHHQLTFGLVYAWSENFVLPLSHDEVVHLKGSLLEKMPGDRWQQLANLRALLAWMWAHPGKQPAVHGWRASRSAKSGASRAIDCLLGVPPTPACTLVREAQPRRGRRACALGRDFARGFQWLSADDADRSTYVFARHDPSGGACPSPRGELTPVPREVERTGYHEARWVDLLNSVPSTSAAAASATSARSTPTTSRGTASPTPPSSASRWACSTWLRVVCGRCGCCCWPRRVRAKDPGRAARGALRC